MVAIQYSNEWQSLEVNPFIPKGLHLIFIDLAIENTLLIENIYRIGTYISNYSRRRDLMNQSVHDKLNKTRSDLVKEITVLTDTQFNRKPGTEMWSIAQ